jgi:non-ribosomal peptide synthetase component F
MPAGSFTSLTPLAFLERSADVFADKTAIAYRDRRLSYSEFGADATRLAHALRASGVRPCGCREPRPCSSCGMFVLVEDASEAIAPTDVEVRDLV